VPRTTGGTGVGVSVSTGVAVIDGAGDGVVVASDVVEVVVVAEAAGGPAEPPWSGAQAASATRTPGTQIARRGIRSGIDDQRREGSPGAAVAVPPVSPTHPRPPSHGGDEPPTEFRLSPRPKYPMVERLGNADGRTGG
jgi:hypothetical protein